MKKIFLAIYFIVACHITATTAKVLEMNELDQNQAQASKEIDTTLPDGMPDPNDLDEVTKFFKERFRTATVDYASDPSELNKTGSINIQHSKEYIEQMQAQNKSFFEKIYDKAMDRISNGSEASNTPSETVFYQLAEDYAKPQNEVSSELPNLAVVNVMLPTGKQIVAPAREHIPYLLSSYNILPTGLIQVQEDVTVVANGQKLKHGLTKVLDKNSKSRANVSKKIDLQLLSVTINGQEIEYVLEEVGDKIYIKPKNEYILQPGVYTYSFKYLMDRKLWYYDDFSEFYVDVTGSYLNLVIASANAIVSVPNGRDFMSQNVLVGRNGRFSDRRVLVASLDTNALGFASTTSLLPAEGMHLLVALDKNVFIEPDWNRRFVWFVTDYGDVLFSFLGFFAILLSYMYSWRYLKRQQKSRKASGVLSSAVLRSLFRQNFDHRAFVAGLLELCKNDVIDIQRQGQAILLIKKTDNLSKLSLSDRKVVSELFSGRDTSIELSNVNMLKFKRAFRSMEKGVKISQKLMSLKLNLGYLLFSIGMLIFTEIAIAYLAFNPMQMAFILLFGTLTIAFYVWVLKRKIKNKIVRYIVKFFASLFIVFAVLLISVYVKLISALLIALMIYCIFEYDELFSKKSGLIKSFIKEAEDIKNYLISNAENISKSQMFCSQQAYIFALELEKYYPYNEYNKSVYKLDLANQILFMM